jgi:hypothetical protein
MTAPRGPKVRFLVMLEGECGNDDNAHVNTLRCILKHLLRARSLKCTDVREVSNEGEQS